MAGGQPGRESRAGGLRGVPAARPSGSNGGLKNVPGGLIDLDPGRIVLTLREFGEGREK